MDTTLGECFTLVKGRAAPSDLPEALPYVGMEHIDPGTPWVSRTATAREVSSVVGLFGPGDVLFGRLRPYLRKVALADFPGCASTEILILRAKKEMCLPAYLQLLASSDGCIDHAVAASAGSRMPRTKVADLGSFEVSLPSLAEQRRIVDVMAAVDGQIKGLKAEEERLRQVYSNASMLLWSEDGSEAPSRPLAEVMTLDVHRIALDDSTEYRLAGVLNAGQGLLDKGPISGSELAYGSMNALRSGQVVMRKLTAWEGPITVVPTQFDGFVASSEFPTFTLRPDVTSEWMKHVCRTPRLWNEMKNRVTGSVQRRKRLNPQQLLSVSLPVPSLTRQRLVAEALDPLSDHADHLAFEAEALRICRATLLSALLSQQVEIPESYDALLDDAVEVSS